MDDLYKMQGCPCFMPEAVNLWEEDIIVSTEIDCRRIKTCRNLALRFLGSAIPFCLREEVLTNAVDSGGTGGDAPG